MNTKTMDFKGIMLHVKPNSKNNYIKQLSENIYEIAISSKPEKGKANKEIIEELAKYFNVKKTQVTIVQGHKSREKRIQITEC